ncbi:hypothetical protein ACHQM5_019319 [Ranunculus cassubicifolius]
MALPFDDIAAGSFFFCDPSENLNNLSQSIQESSINNVQRAHVGDSMLWLTEEMLIETEVEGYYNMKDKSWHSGQDPYVAIEYESTKFKTTTCGMYFQIDF